MTRVRLGRALGITLFAASVAFAVVPLHAQDAKGLSGVVLTLDGGEVVIDLGKKQGVADGDTLELWRPLKLKHPVTGKLVVDRFKIGALKVSQAREVMSLARPVGVVSRPIEAGDVVILPGGGAPAPQPTVVTPTKPKPAAPASTGPTPGPAATVVVEADPEVRALGILFEGLSGTDPVVRAKAYEQWVRDNPKSRFAGVVQEEAIALRKTGAAPAAAPALGGPAPVPETPTAAAWNRIDETRENMPFTFALQLAGPVTGAIMQVRAAEEPAFTPYPLTPSGKGYWTVTIPKEHVRGPALSWFIEAITPDTKAVAVVGSSAMPIITKVVSNPETSTPLKHESFASLWTDYANYNKLKDNDFAWQTEGYFGMRFGDVGMRAVRSGFGVYRGRGGSIEDLDGPRQLKGRGVGLSYGYLEGEFGFDAIWALITRISLGLDKEEVVGGGQAFLRIGNDKKTNLMIGGEILGGVGLRGITQIQLALFPRIPLMVRSEVTNQPAGSSVARGSLRPEFSEGAGDLGVRMIGQAGYKFTDGFVFFLRFSYQGRTINHAGPGFGAGASFAW